MLVDLTTARTYIRADDEDEDSLIVLMLSDAEGQVAQFLNRNVYETQAELDAAIAAAPAALTAATAVYDAAIADADAMEDGAEKDAAVKYAEEAYTNAQSASDMAQRGMVVNDSVKLALLIVLAELFEHRGDDGAGQMPEAAKRRLWPFRVGVGV